MDIDTFITLFSAIKAHTIFLTNCFKPNNEKFDYILDPDFNTIAKLSLASCALLCIKEDLIETNKNLILCKTIPSSLEKCVNEISIKTENGLIVDNYLFKNSENLINTVRNKLAHGEFKIDLSNQKVLFYIDNTFVGINTKKLIEMITKTLECYYLQVENNTYQKTIAINNKFDKNRANPLNTKSEIRGFLKTCSAISFTLTKLDNTKIDEPTVKLVNKAIDYFQETQDLNYLINVQKTLRAKNYIFNWEKSPIKKDYIEELTNYTYINYPKDINHKAQVNFILNDIEKRIQTKQNLVKSICKNINLLDIAYKNNTVNYSKILNEYKKVCSYDTIGYEELATTSFALFESLFSYGNDKFLENDYEYTFTPSNGLDYSALDLSKIKVIYIDKDNKEKNSIKIEIESKKNKIENIDNKITTTRINLENLKKQNNTKAIKIVTNNLNNLEIERNKLYQELQLLSITLNEKLLYENYYMNHLRNKAIINGIRNSISHGNYYIKAENDHENSIVFEDIYEDNKTFICEVNIADFINLMYKNSIIIKEYIEKETTKSQSR